MAETAYLSYGTTQSNVPAELKVYYQVVERTAAKVTLDIDVGVHFIGEWSSNGCWVRVDGTNRACNPDHITGGWYWYASSQGNSRSAYWKRVTLSAAAADTVVKLPVGFSNTAWAAGTFQTKEFTLSIPVGNTNAYWNNPTCTVSPAGVIPENTEQLTVSWSGAKDDQGDTIRYYVEIWKNGSFTGMYVGGGGTTDRSGTVDISGDGPGTSYYFRTYCQDEGSESRVFGKQSATVTKNAVTPMTAFHITLPAIIAPAQTVTISCSHDLPKNANGNKNFTYSLEAFFVASSQDVYTIPVYGATSSHLASSPFTVTVWDESGSTPSGMYMKQSEIREACGSAPSPTYTGLLRFRLKYSNQYGSAQQSIAEKSLNWQFTPEAPTSPMYTAESYVTLPNQEGPVFLINRRAITWEWGAVADPNGTAISYQVYTKTGNNSWILAANTNRPTYTTPISALSQSQTYQIKVTARSAYGTTSAESLGPAVELQYYNLPQVTASILERNQGDVTIKTSVHPSTSLSNSIGAVSLSYSGAVSGNTVTSAPPFRSSFEEKKQFTGLAETTAGMVRIYYSDSVMNAVQGNTASLTATVMMTEWSALLTIREKGIGIQSIAGDYADFTVKGTTVLYGGDSKEKKDGHLALSTQSSAAVDLYSGIYVDGDGNYRAAQGLAPGGYVFHVQTYHPSTLSMPPLRWRCMYAATPTQKDALFVPTYISEWTNLADSNLAGVNHESLAAGLVPYLKTDFLRNNGTDGLWRKRDCGYWSGSGGTGQLLIPVGTNQTGTEYGQVELSLMWQNSGYAQKLWCSWYSSGSTHYVNGSYLNTIPNTTVRLVWNPGSSLKYLCIGTTSTAWSNLRMVNVDQYISRSASYKPSSMNPFISSASYTALGTTGTLSNAGGSR